MLRIGRLPLDLLNSLQSCSNQICSKIQQSQLGIRNIGDGVYGAQDGVFGFVTKCRGKKSTSTKTTQRSKKRSILEQSIKKTSRSWSWGGNGEDHGGCQEERCEVSDGEDHLENGMEEVVVGVISCELLNCPYDTDH